MTTWRIFSISSGAAPSWIIILISIFLTLAMEGFISFSVRETTLSFTGESIFGSGLVGVVVSGASAVKSKPGIGRPTLPLAGASLEVTRSLADCNDCTDPSFGEKVVSLSIALLTSRSTLTSITYLRLSITFSIASEIRFLRLFSIISF